MGQGTLPAKGTAGLTPRLSALLRLMESKEEAYFGTAYFGTVASWHVRRGVRGHAWDAVGMQGAGEREGRERGH